ncbi:hypothetical protein [Kitasatospora camelliae]|uniref:SMI1/KNR4 family protein n=1 Tax=Kitasatospora camelliae TaxID=3156397 RepID=A0AAU8K372_9ACTN
MTAEHLLRTLPAPADLRAQCRAMAAAEAVLNPDGYRYHAFDPAWAEGVEAYSLRNGAGDECDAVFSPEGVLLRGFDHESPMSPYVEDRPWPGVLDSVPAPLARWTAEPAFTADGMPAFTFCLWREPGDDGWRTGEIDYPGGDPAEDGSGWLLHLLADGGPEAFRDWAQHYYDRPVDLAAVRALFGGSPLTPGIAAALHAGLAFDRAAAAVAAAGWPVGD